MTDFRTISGLLPVIRLETSNKRSFEILAFSNTLHHFNEKSAFSNAPPNLETEFKEETNFKFFRIIIHKSKLPGNT